MKYKIIQIKINQFELKFFINIGKDEWQHFETIKLNSRINVEKTLKVMNALTDEIIEEIK